MFYPQIPARYDQWGNKDFLSTIISGLIQAANVQMAMIPWNDSNLMLNFVFELRLNYAILKLQPSNNTTTISLSAP